jgi:hypothetical protein
MTRAINYVGAMLGRLLWQVGFILAGLGAFGVLATLLLIRNLRLSARP